MAQIIIPGVTLYWLHENKFKQYSGIEPYHLRPIWMIAKTATFGANCYAGNFVTVEAVNVGANCVLQDGCVVRKDVPAGTTIPANSVWE